MELFTVNTANSENDWRNRRSSVSVVLERGTELFLRDAFGLVRILLPSPDRSGDTDLDDRWALA